MPLTHTKDLFAKALKGKYALGAFNVNNMELIQAIVEACEEEKAPLILQISKGARSYAKPGFLQKNNLSAPHPAPPPPSPPLSSTRFPKEHVPTPTRFTSRNSLRPPSACPTCPSPSIWTTATRSSCANSALTRDS